MPFNGNGVFTRLYSWSNDALAGIKIRADRMDNETNGIATGLSNCITKDGQTTVTANLPMATFKHTGVGAATNRTDYAQAAQLVEGVINWKVAGGTGDAITATYTIPTTTLVDGQLFYIRASAANTLTAPTFAPDGLTARTITAQGGGSIAVGAIQNLVEMVLRYNLANTRYEWVNYSAGNVVGQASSVDSEIALFSGTGGKTIKRATGTGFAKLVNGVLQTPVATIGTTEITDDAVTLAKIQNATANSKLLGSGDAGSGAPYAELTLGTNLSMSGTTLNAAGGVTKATTTISSVASVTFSSLDFQNNEYEFILKEIQPATNSQNFIIEISTDNFATDTTNVIVNSVGQNASVFEAFTAETGILAKAQGNANTQPYNWINGYIRLSQLVSGRSVTGQFQVGYARTGSGVSNQSGTLSQLIADLPSTFFNAVRFKFASGNLASGYITILTHSRT